MVLSCVITVRVPFSLALAPGLLDWPEGATSRRVSPIPSSVLIDEKYVSNGELSPSSGGSRFISYL